MPWTSEDAKKHKKGLIAGQAKKWARVANVRLRVCLAEGSSRNECEVSAIRIANAVCVKGGRRK